MHLLQKLLGKKSICSGIVGISLLPQGITIAIAKYAANNSLRLSHCEFISADQPSDQLKILAQLTEQYALTDYDCHLVLTANHYQMINIEQPAVADNELREAVRWKINDLLDFPAEQADIDYYPLPAAKQRDSKQILAVIASPKETVMKLADNCLDSDLQLKVIDIQETVLRNLAVLLPENNRGVAVLHLEQSSGMIIIQQEGSIFLSRKLDFGYAQLGLSTLNGTDSQVESQQDNLSLEIQRSLDYVESYYGLPPVSCLAVIPMPENTNELLNFLNHNHGITARIMDLTTIMDCDILLDDTTQSLCSPAIGATLRYQVETA